MSTFDRLTSGNREMTVAKQAHVRKLRELGMDVSTPEHLQQTLVELAREMPGAWRDAAGGLSPDTDVQVRCLGPEDSLEGPYYVLEARAWADPYDLPQGCELRARYLQQDVRVTDGAPGL